MAQICGYFEDNVIYTEGPFVMVQAFGWRIEAEVKGHKCPTLPDIGIYKLLETNNKQAHKTDNKEKIIESVDWLNLQVKNGLIIQNEYGIYVTNTGRGGERIS